MKKLSRKKTQGDLWMGTIKEVSKALAEKYAKEGFETPFFEFAMVPDDDKEDLNTIYKNVSILYDCCLTETNIENTGCNLYFSYFGYEGAPSTSNYIFNNGRPDIKEISSEFEQGICHVLEVSSSSNVKIIVVFHAKRENHC